MKFNQIIIIFLLLLTGCENKDTPLYTALKEIEAEWSIEMLEKYAQKIDTFAVSDIHFSYGMYFRNQKLRNPKDPTLLNYFYSLNVHHEDYMSSIVFLSLHRKLNKKPIDLEGQLDFIYKIVAEEKAKEDKNTVRALKYYHKFQERDTVLVRMTLHDNYAASHAYPEDVNWIHNDSIDLLIKGTIVEKKVIQNTLDMSFELKVLSVNKNNIKYYGDTIDVGDILEVDFRYHILEDVE